MLNVLSSYYLDREVDGHPIGTSVTQINPIKEFFSRRVSVTLKEPGVSGELTGQFSRDEIRKLPKERRKRSIEKLFSPRFIPFNAVSGTGHLEQLKATLPSNVLIDAAPRLSVDRAEKILSGVNKGVSPFRAQDSVKEATELTKIAFLKFYGLMKIDDATSNKIAQNVATIYSQSTHN